MSVKKPTKDIMQRDMTKMSYTDYNGRTSMVVQYASGFNVNMIRDSRGSEEPIYVAFEGEQPEELSLVLSELRQYRTRTKFETDRLEERANRLTDRLNIVEETVSTLRPKSRNFWRWGRE